MSTGNAHNGGMLVPEATQIETASGLFIDLLAPDPAVIEIGDIAQALSLTCRYGGHVKRFYSVAEHAVLVHDLLEWQGLSEELLLAGLLHDAAEAYLGDIVSPLKYALRYRQWSDDLYTMSPLDGYRGAYSRLSDGLDAAIAKRFGVEARWFDDVYVKTADMWALKIEAAELTASGGENWRWPGELPNGGERPDYLEWHRGRQPEGAREMFLKRTERRGLA